MCAYKDIATLTKKGTKKMLKAHKIHLNQVGVDLDVCPAYTGFYKKVSKEQFGVELGLLGTVDQDGVAIPHTLVNLLTAIKPLCMTVGIFRVGGTKGRVRRIQLLLNDGDKVVELDEYELPDLIACLKKWIVNLRSPLIPVEIQQAILAIGLLNLPDYDHDQKLALLMAALTFMPKLNLETLKHLFVFIKDEVVAKSEFNQMPSENVAYSFAPTLLQTQDNSSETLAIVAPRISAESAMVKILIDNAECIGGVSRLSLNNVTVWVFLCTGNDLGENAEPTRRRRFSWSTGGKSKDKRRSSSVVRRDEENAAAPE